MSDRGDVLFREVQFFRQRWLWILLSAVIVIPWWALIQQVVFDVPFGSNPAPDAVLIAIWLAFGVLLPMFFFSIRLITEVRSDAVYIRFVPFHLSPVRIPVASLKNQEIRIYNPIREYGGWGIRYGFRARLTM